MKLNFDETLNFGLWEREAVLITGDYQAKKTNLTTADICALRYVGIQVITAWYKDIGADQDNSFIIDDHNAMQDDELYLMDFEGIDIDGEYTMKSIYMTETGRFIADCWNNETDDERQYLLD